MYIHMLVKLKHVYGFSLRSIKNIKKVLGNFENIAKDFAISTRRFIHPQSRVYFIMPCNGICQKYKVKRPSRPHTRYGLGQKRCTMCDIFTLLEGNRCPCCSGLLRSNPKGAFDRKQLMKIKNVQRI